LTSGTSSHASRKALSTLVGLLGRGLVSGGDVAEMFSLYRATFSLQAIVAGQQYGFEAFGRSEDVPEDWMAAHRAVSDRDPAPSWLTSAPVGSVYRAGTHGSPKLAIGREFYRFGWRDCAVTMMPTPFGGPFWMGLYRRVGAKKFSDHEATLVSLLHPHLSAALTTRSALAAIEADRAETFDHALSRFEGHAFVTVPELRVSWSGRARAMFGELLGHTPTRMEWQNLERLLADIVSRYAMHPVAGRTHRIGRGLRAELAHVPPRGSERRRVVVLFLREGGSAPEPSASPLLRLLGARQREVALRAARGESLKLIAVALGISHETARSHLSAVYRRLGVSTRAELASLLA
jgi:DNA-binding CsgD family transcriptional regulator